MTFKSIKKKTLTELEKIVRHCEKALIGPSENARTLAQSNLDIVSSQILCLENE